MSIDNLPMDNLRQEAHRLVDSLPENFTWEDLMYRIYVRQSIERGLADCEAGRVVDDEEVRRRLGLDS